MEANDYSIKLYYNTEREKLQMPEYGRIVLNMVEQVKAIPDKAKRSEQAKAVVRVMELLNPQVHTQENYEQKLWDHLYMIAGYDLDIDSPYPAPHPEAMDVPPMVIPIDKSPVRANHYGRNIESIIDLIAGRRGQEGDAAFPRDLYASAVPDLEQGQCGRRDYFRRHREIVRLSDSDPRGSGAYQDLL